MKSTDGFDARRLRPRTPSSWKSRFGMAVALLLLAAGLATGFMGCVVLTGAGDTVLEELNPGYRGAIALVSLSLILLWSGRACWQRSRRPQQRTDELIMSPHLLKKRH